MAAMMILINEIFVNELLKPQGVDWIGYWGFLIKV